MEIIKNEPVDMMKYGHFTCCEVYCIHVKIEEPIEDSVEHITNDVLDTSWIEKLTPELRKSYEPAARRTIKNIMESIKNKEVHDGYEVFWQYLISFSAQKALEKEHGHTKIPLSELFKEKSAGNPGFDFHAETNGNYIAFGESKYSKEGTPRKDALDGVLHFIDTKQDDYDLIFLKHFVTGVAYDNAQSNKKSYVAAFSVNAENPDVIFENALNSEAIKKLLELEEIILQEIYIVAIEVCR